MAKRIPWRRLVALSLAACGGSTAGGTAGGDGGTTSSGPDAAVSPSDADGAVPEAGTPADAPCTSCIGKSLSWGENGGLVAYVDTSALAPCRTYTRSRTGRVDDGGPSSCSTELGDCGSASAPVAIGDIEAALVDPDVQKALAAPTTPLYGVDSRPVDGAVFEITVGGHSIDVGTDCTAGAKGCVPIPAGVRALEQVLQALDAQELAKPACAALSHP